jgi:hypothetical protein
MPEMMPSSYSFDTVVGSNWTMTRKKAMSVSVCLCQLFISYKIVQVYKN